MEKGRRFYCTRKDGCGDKFCTRDEDRGCPFAYDENKWGAHAYDGPDWPPPRLWRAADGTVVYRSYSDSLD